MYNQIKKFLSDPNKREFIDGVLCGFILLNFSRTRKPLRYHWICVTLSLACCIFINTMNKHNMQRKTTLFELLLSLILGITAIDLIVLLFVIILD